MEEAMTLKTAQALDDPTPRERRRIIARVLLRALASTIVLVALYYLLPMDAAVDSRSVIVLTICLVLFVAAVAWRVRAITRSDRPGLRAIESLTAAIPLYVLLFAAAYYLAERADPGSFTQPMDRTGALYLSVTILSTVGFGDISAKTDAARLVVTFQMLLDLVLLGAGVKIVLGAVNMGRARINQQELSQSVVDGGDSTVVDVKSSDDSTAGP
jgi:voltage-gated potassium channel